MQRNSCYSIGMKKFMSATTAALAQKGSNLVQTIIVGGLIVFVLRLLDYLAVFSLILKVPAAILLQYIASGLLGEAAFAGGVGTTLLGVLFHFIISMIVATVFLMAAAKIPVMHRNLILAGIVYAVIVWFVMNMVVTPLSAAPAADPPPPTWAIVESLLGHIIMVGLPLAFLAKRALGEE